MDWKTWYQEHCCSAEEAVRRIQSGDRVVVAHATGEPSYILDAMVANADQYEKRGDRPHGGHGQGRVLQARI